MSLNHHFIAIPHEETKKLESFQQAYMVDGKIVRYHAFSDVPRPIDSDADDVAGQLLIDFYLANKKDAVPVRDEIILKHLKNFATVHTLFIGFIPCVGLNYYGMTIIPRESIQEFATSIKMLQDNPKLSNLLDLCEKAYISEKDILHCGI